MLSGFPRLSVSSVISGEFASGFESYLSDGVFGRDDIVGLSESVLRVFSASTDEDDALLSNIQMAGELQGQQPEEETASDDDASGDVQTSAPQESDTPQPEASGSDIGESDAQGQESVADIDGFGLWLEKPDGGYLRALTVTEEQLIKVASALNKYKDALPEDGYVFYTNVPLTKTGHILKDSGSYIGWTENLDTGMQPYLEDGVYFVNSPEILEEGLLAGEDIYFYSDHHWTPLGAIKVVNECMRIQGVPVISYDEYSYKTNLFVNKKNGTQDDLALPYPLQNTVGHTLPKGEVGDERVFVNHGSSHYVAFLGGDSKIFSRYVTGFSTGRRALVIGDSFSNPFTVYLAPYYDEVYKVDARFYDSWDNGGSIAELIEKYGVDDVYFVLSYANGVAYKTSIDKLEDALLGLS